MGPWQGGQAELLRVPYADFNCLRLPEDAEEKEDDYVMLSDIFPTGWHGVELSGFLPGESIAIYGAGPVGLMAAHSAEIRGASQIFVVDTHDDRLKLAEAMGAIPIDMRKGDLPTGRRNGGLGTTGGRGSRIPVLRSPPQGAGNYTMNCLVKHEGHRRDRRRRRVHSGRPERARRSPEGRQDGVRLRQLLVQGSEDQTGQCNVKHYNRRLMSLSNRTGPILPKSSPPLPLDQAPDAYKHFDERDAGWTKVVLKPRVLVFDGTGKIMTLEGKSVAILITPGRKNQNSRSPRKLSRRRAACDRGQF